MTGPIRVALADLSTRFPILPARLADALDVHDGSALAWAWIDDGRLLRLEVER
jgi:hypothetical protein